MKCYSQCCADAHAQGDAHTETQRTTIRIPVTGTLHARICSHEPSSVNFGVLAGMYHAARSQASGFGIRLRQSDLAHSADRNEKKQETEALRVRFPACSAGVDTTRAGRD